MALTERTIAMCEAGDKSGLLTIDLCEHLDGLPFNDEEKRVAAALCVATIVYKFKITPADISMWLGALMSKGTLVEVLKEAGLDGDALATAEAAEAEVAEYKALKAKLEAATGSGN